VSHNDAVTVRITEELIPTYLPDLPERCPMFFERRVYQGSSGRVYPLPCTDRIAETKTERAWQAVWLENAYLRVLVLPEIGGRIHAAQDKTNGYDFIYRQTVIKPALVGLAGPWVSGGVEFNWPQHHRPATFLPVDFHVEDHPDGSKTLWLSDHDPLLRMKGMHGVCLHPGQALLELKVRVYNRTPLVQTFLWWANAAVRAHEGYQSFFPPDVSSVADHARRAISRYPLCEGCYYGVDYGRRAGAGVPPGQQPAHFRPPHCGGSAALDYPPHDLSWYANIPVPTSYMALGSREDFVGGYDHLRRAGVVHVADHHIAPGKKQWTWGNHEFGYAWDRNLTDSDGPYLELMAGVYTDNQPDFSFLQPGETKTWSQYWYPIQQIGPVQAANRQAALGLQAGGGMARLGVAVSAPLPEASVTVGPADGDAAAHSPPLARFRRDLLPGAPLVESIELPPELPATELVVRVLDRQGAEILAYRPRPPATEIGRRKGTPPPAKEPPPPEDIASSDELFITGLHLEQYRHATRSPTLYWQEALRRDPFDARANNALGLWHLRRGEFPLAEPCFRRAIQRLTGHNPNPYDGEPFYNLGLCLRYQLDAGDCPDFRAATRSVGPKMGLSPSAGTHPAADDLFRDAYAAFYKATWNQAWSGAGCLALAEMDCRRGRWATALEHLDRALGRDSDNLRVRDLRAVVLRKLGRHAEAERFLADTLALDPLDWWARGLAGGTMACDLQVLLDLAHDYARAGLYAEAVAVLGGADTASGVSTEGDSPIFGPTLRVATQESGQSPGGPPLLPTQSWGAAPLVDYTLGWLHQRLGDQTQAEACYRRASARATDYCFPARLEEIAVLQSAMDAVADDARAPYYLGNLLYDRRRHGEAMALWERSARLDPDNALVWRNLGIGYFNVRRRPAKARAAYERAFRADPGSARILYERDQLWKRLGDRPAKRLHELERHRDLVARRDDLTVEICALYNQTGRHQEALTLLSGRKFQPWEGGEGQALGQYVRSRLALGRGALSRGDAAAALAHFLAAAAPPQNLGEARHLLSNQADVQYWLGCARAALGEKSAARQHWLAAANSRGDFEEMSFRPFSALTYYSALAWRQLGRKAKAKRLLAELLAYAEELEHAEAKIDYFATSLPTMLLFDDDLAMRQATQARFLQAQARLGLGQKARAGRLLQSVLQRDPHHALAADLLASGGMPSHGAAVGRHVRSTSMPSALLRNVTSRHPSRRRPSPAKPPRAKNSRGRRRD
jgi:tetratricopeptide (TPR) repeat protein